MRQALAGLLEVLFFISLMGMLMLLGALRAG